MAEHVTSRGVTDLAGARSVGSKQSTIQTPEDMAAHARLSPVATSEMSRLHSAGFWLIPLGGDDGKKPIVEFRGRKRQPLSLVVDRMAAAGSLSYGIRLRGLLVIDVDTDTSEARDYVEQRFGTSSARTLTARGFHLFFRHSGPKPRPVRLPDISIDFKSGENEFVVGVQSERPDGVVYWPEGRLIAPDALPSFVDRDKGSSTPERAKVNGRYPRAVRWTTLKERACQLAASAETFDALVADLLGFRDWEIERPQEFSDRRVTDLARWFWDKRENGELWGAANSVVQIRRTALEELARRGDGRAFLLHGILVADHGHDPDALFAIVPDGLRKNGRLRAGRRQIYAAIDVLLELRLLLCRSKPCGRRNHYLYQLATGMREEREEGSKLILVSEKDTHGAPGKERAA